MNAATVTQAINERHVPVENGNMNANTIQTPNSNIATLAAANHQKGKQILGQHFDFIRSRFFILEPIPKLNHFL